MEGSEIEIVDSALRIGGFLTVTLGIVVLFVGKRLNKSIPILRKFSIPEPVTGGLLCSILFGLIYALSGITVEFDLAARDFLLIYFFTTIGINASLGDLAAGGKPLLILLAIAIGYMSLQNLVGIGVAKLCGLAPQVGVVGGTISLIGGHGTAIAWAPRVAEDFGVENAAEIGIACATFGLILASIQGGPIARFLVRRFNLKSDVSEEPDIGIAESKTEAIIDYFAFLNAVLAIHICIIIGLTVHDVVESLGVQLPEFVLCLLTGIVLSNLLPRFGGKSWPARTPAVALVADISLGTFLAMSLMSLQLSTLLDLAGPIIFLLSAQLLVAVAVTLFVVFPAMGRNYDAAVVSAGFGGITLGSTPTAMANMSAVTQHYGGSHIAFIIVPLVCAFFIDLANALFIPFFLRLS